jgi:hyperosmotically inducible periplasmic protein
MKSRIATNTVMAALVTGMVGGYTGCTPNADPTPSRDRSPSESMSLAGQQTESAAKNVYEGTATAVTDTTITAKVKLALHDDKVTGRDYIHVDTVAGVVTLGGQVTDEREAARAERIARSTSGVRDVVNNLRLQASSSQQ